MGVAAGIEYAKTGKSISGYTDTGVELIAHSPVNGVTSKDSNFWPRRMLGVINNFHVF